MIRYPRLEHRFVHYIPEILEPGVIYISVDYATAVHSCCCGCGAEIVTPLTPTDWKMIFDGETISLSPSVGNWKIPCRSHYVIERNRVIEAPLWNDDEIAFEDRRDKRAKEAYYNRSDGAGADRTTSDLDVRTEDQGLWSHITKWFNR